MPAAGEHHRQAALVGGGDHFRVAHRSARLHDRGRAGVGDRVEAVAEREERVGRGDGSLRASPAPPSSPRPSPRRRGSSARRRPPACDRRPVKMTAFDFTCAQTRHAKRSAVHSSAVGCAFRHDLRKVAGRPRLGAPRSRDRAPATARRRGTTAILLRPARAAARHAARRSRPSRRAGSAWPPESACASSSSDGAITASMNVDVSARAVVRVERPVQPDDAAEGRQRIGLARADVGLGDASRRSPRRTDSCA